MSEIDKLIAAASAAAVSKHSDQSTRPKASTYANACLQPVRRALADVGICDDRMAVVITLAKAEARASKLADGGVHSLALNREIHELTELLNG